MSTLTRYALFQVPGWLIGGAVCTALWSTGGVPAWAAGVLLALWVAKDAALYPLLRKGYEGAPTGVEELIGSRGIVREPLAPSGFVEIRGTLWRAEIAPGEPSVGRGERVTVCAASGLTLRVTALVDERAAR
jgi:membrane protein implicated in regulation of membrane protease activity